MALKESRKAALMLPGGVCCGMGDALLYAAGGCRSPQHPAVTLTCLGCLEYSQKKFWTTSGQKLFKFLFHICTALVTPHIIREKIPFISKL